MAAAAGTDAAGLRRVLRSILSLLIAYVVPRLATFAAAVVAARAVGVTAFGAYGTAAALAVILSIAATLGMMQLLVRDLARAPAEAPRLVAAANVAKAGSGALMLIALAVTAVVILDYPGRVAAAAMLLGVSYAVGAYVENLGAYFQSVERMGVWMQAQAAFGIVSGALGIGLVLTTRSIVWFCAAPIAGQAAALGWLLIRAPAPIRTAWRAPWPDVRRLLRSLLPFAAAFVALTAYYKVDILLLERWRGEGEAGLYAAAYKFVDIAQALALVVATAVYPRLSRWATSGFQRPEHHPDEEAGEEAGGQTPAARWAATRVVELLILAGVPAAGLLWLARAPLVTWLYGAGYSGSISVLSLLAPALPALALNVLGTFVLAAAQRMRTVAGLYAVALVLNVTLNAILIPAFASVGTAAAMVGSEWLLALAMLRVLDSHAAAAPGARAASAAVAAAGIVGLLGASGLPAALSVPASLLAIAAMYSALRVIPAREMALLRSAVRP